ncbi:MAG TPA: LacI family DNA-binding transcriptional regulator [Candidatus Eisenbacteria bacterium]|jgi:LacI family transcriptional regulator
MATIKDVAREAGVSVATVSRVLNNSAAVSESTRAHVREVAARLNYFPNGAARSLSTSRTHVIGVLLPDLFGEFFSEVLRGMDSSVRQAGFHLLVSSSHADAEQLLAALHTMRGRIDGLIVMAPDVDARAAIQATTTDFPLLLIDPGVGVEGCNTISIANYDGAYAVVRHLLGLGHRRIATIMGPLRNIDAQQRLAGYRAALRDAGAPSEPELEIPGDFTEPSGYEGGSRLCALATPVTAVFAANDYMAIGVMGALSDAGIRVPEDVAVAGFDDIAMSRYLNPPLTTVRVDPFRLGERAVGRLLSVDRSAVGKHWHHEVLPTSLVVRGSCGSTWGGRARSGAGPLRGR